MKFDIADIIGQKFYESTNLEVKEAIENMDDDKTTDFTYLCKNTRTKNMDPGRFGCKFSENALKMPDQPERKYL